MERVPRPEKRSESSESTRTRPAGNRGGGCVCVYCRWGASRGCGEQPGPAARSESSESPKRGENSKSRTWCEAGEATVTLIVARGTIDGDTARAGRGGASGGERRRVTASRISLRVNCAQKVSQVTQLFPTGTRGRTRTRGKRAKTKKNKIKR